MTRMDPTRRTFLTQVGAAVTLRNLERVPDWHAAGGGGAWLFVDEIVVE